MRAPRSGLTPRVLALSCLCCALAAAQTPTSGIRFIERAQASGITVKTVTGNVEQNYIIETIGAGSAMFDYDLDGDLDVYIVNGSTLEPIVGEQPIGHLYRNDGTGRFADVTAGSGLGTPFWGFGAAAGDYDNDGDPDLFVTAWGPNHLFRNEGGGLFTDVGREAGVDLDRYGTSTTFLDYDRDGLLDLYAANYLTFDQSKVPSKDDPNSPCNFRGLRGVMCGPHGLPGAVDVLYHNNGDGTFTDVTAEAGLFTEPIYFGLAVLAADIDGDGLTDILQADDSTPNHYYRNLGDGRFSDDALMAGFAYSADGREQAGMGLDAADIDADGDLDVIQSAFSHDYCNLRLNDGQGNLEDVSVRVGLVEPTLRSLSWGTLLFDIENDGDYDIFIANGHVYPAVDKADIGTTYLQANQIFENLGGLKLAEVIAPPGGAMGEKGLHRGLAGGDIDNDGDIDLLVTVLSGRPKLYINESPAGAWLGVRLVGRAANRDGMGVRAVLRAGGRTWLVERMGGRGFLSTSDPRLHFGLGKISQIDALEVRWPSGVVQTVSRPPVNTYITVEEPAKNTANSASGKTVSP